MQEELKGDMSNYENMDHMSGNMGNSPSYRTGGTIRTVNQDNLINIPKYEKLYKLGEAKMKKKSQEAKLNSGDFSFKPQVNKSQITASFRERQEYYNHKREEKRQL